MRGNEGRLRGVTSSVGSIKAPLDVPMLTGRCRDDALLCHIVVQWRRVGGIRRWRVNLNCRLRKGHCILANRMVRGTEHVGYKLAYSSQSKSSAEFNESSVRGASISSHSRCHATYLASNEIGSHLDSVGSHPQVKVVLLALGWSGMRRSRAYEHTGEHATSRSNRMCE